MGSNPKLPPTLRRTAPSFLLDTLSRADPSGSRETIYLDVRAIAHLHGELAGVRHARVPQDVYTEIQLTIAAALERPDRVRGWRVERVEDARRMRLRCTRVPIDDERAAAAAGV